MPARACGGPADRSTCRPTDAVGVVSRSVDMSNEPAEQEDHEGVVDATSILYIVGGIPAMVTFFVVLFLFTRSCNIAA